MYKSLAQMIRVQALRRALRDAGLNWMLQDPELLKDYQLSRLNEVWSDAIANISFYAWWKTINNLRVNVRMLMVWVGLDFDPGDQISRLGDVGFYGKG